MSTGRHCVNIRTAPNQRYAKDRQSKPAPRIVHALFYQLRAWRHRVYAYERVPACGGKRPVANNQPGATRQHQRLYQCPVHFRVGAGRIYLGHYLRSDRQKKSIVAGHRLLRFLYRAYGTDAELVGRGHLQVHERIWCGWRAGRFIHPVERSMAAKKANRFLSASCPSHSRLAFFRPG